MTISLDLRSNLVELFDATTNPEVLAKKEPLIELLSNAADEQQAQNAWQAIIQTLNPEYWVARDNTTKFNKVEPHIEALAATVRIAKDALNGKLVNNSGLAEDVTQFIFKVSNLYSVASTRAPDNFDLCTSWLEIARQFIAENGLLESKQHAIWYNLTGGHKSRKYQMDSSIGRPSECVDDFRNAVRIRKEILHNSLDNPKDIDLRHVQMCLSSTLMQDAIWRVMHNGTVSEDVKHTCDEVRQYLAELTTERLVLADGTPDLYRRAGCVQALGYVQMLEGHFQDACDSMHKAAELMEASIGSTGATGQLSAILNDEANALIACATALKDDSKLLAAKACFEKSIKLSENKFEQMYADVAKQSLLQIDKNLADYHSVKLATNVLSTLTAASMPALNSGPTNKSEEEETVAKETAENADAAKPYKAKM